MACRLAIAFAVVLATSPVLGQEFGQELELGGGWYQTNPFDVIYDLSGPAGPSVNFAWTRWRNERTGITVGVTTVLSHEGNDIAGRAFFTYGHITWRRRWLQSDGHGSVHVGLGVGADGCLGDVLRRRGPVEGPVPVARRAVLHPARARWAQLAGRDRLHADPLPAAAPDRAAGSDGGLEVVTDPVLMRTGNFMRPVTARRRRVAIWLRTTTPGGRSGFGLLGGVSPLGQAGRASAGAGELPPVACSGAARATCDKAGIVTHTRPRAEFRYAMQMGRSRLHGTNADRQRAYRDRRRGAPPRPRILTQANLADSVGTSVRSIQRAARLERLHAMAPKYFPELELELRRLYDQVNAGKIGLHPALDRAETMIAVRAVTRGPVDH